MRQMCQSRRQMRRFSTLLLTVVAVMPALSTAPRPGVAQDAPATQPSSEATGISGHVTDKDGNPVPKATIVLAKAIPPKPAPKTGGVAKNIAEPVGPSHDGPTTKPTKITFPARTIADAEGNFSFVGIPAGDYVLNGNAPGKGVAHAEVHVDAGQTASA